MGEYTRKVEKSYEDFENNIADITDYIIENINENTSRKLWKEQFLLMEKEFTCSSRFFLMQYLYEKANKMSQRNQVVNRYDSFDSTKMYTIFYDNKKYQFHAVSAEQAWFLSVEERNQYIQLLTKMAADCHGDQNSMWKPLFWKAMLRKKKMEMLSRQEGFQIAHGLKFGLGKAEEFLLRVLDNDGFCYTRSEDIIEAFCFLYEPANNWHIAQELKSRYNRETKNISKREIILKPDDFTRGMAFSLLEFIKEWNESKENDTIEQFMDWLISLAPMLDIPSRSAYQIYGRLANIAYKLTSEQMISVEEDVTNTYHIQNIRNNEQYIEEDFEKRIREYCLQDGFEQIEMDEYKMASVLLRYAETSFDNIRRRKPDQIWRYLTVDDKGRLTAISIGRRIPYLLSGKEAVTKADLLFLLWYVCEIFWDSGSNEREISLYERIIGFWELAKILLNSAMLPRFYVPHILERAFLNAICTEAFIEESPFEIYEGMCEFILPGKKSRNRRKNVDTQMSKQSRAKLEHLVEQRYCEEQLIFEGMEDALSKHILEYGEKDGKYLFTQEGVYYFLLKEAIQNPDLPVTIPYPQDVTGYRFDKNRKDYYNVVIMEERFQFLYGLSLYLTEHVLTNYQCKFRVNYQKNASLSITKMEKRVI